MPDSFAKNIVYLSKAQYQELVTNQSITVDGVTYTYNENDIYVTPQAEPVTDVQVAGTSVVSNGVANVPIGSNSQLGLTRTHTNTFSYDSDGRLILQAAALSHLKEGTNSWRPIMPNGEHIAAFYGLAKAAGDSTQSSSNNSVGTYTADAKSKISDMLSAPETVSGSTPSITAQPGICYECGEVSTLDITLPSSGCIDVIFESGSTPTVLTITPPTGYTIEWTGDVDVNSLEVDTVYEINIKMTGTKCLGVAGAWAAT